MPTQIKVWEIAGGKLISRDDASFANSHSEAELEQWLCKSPDLLGDKLLVICRQLPVPNVGRLDLLCMDVNGKLVIVELKRGFTTREAVAQALDYASWLDAASEDDILASANEYLQHQTPDLTLEDAFEDYFGTKIPEWLCQNHRIIVAAAQLDTSAERIINYLAQRHAIAINAVFFNYAKLLDGKEILIRSVLVPESVRAGRSGADAVTETTLMAMAAEHGTTEMVKLCRRMSPAWWEECSNTAGGSFRFWATRPDGVSKMVFGVNASGELGNVGPGELAVWIRADKLSLITGLEETSIRNQLSKITTPFTAGRMDYILRLKTIQEAERLVCELNNISAGHAKVKGQVA